MTQAHASVVCQRNFLHKLGLNIQNDSNTILDTLISADGQTLKVKGQVTATVNLQGLLVSHTFVVIDGLNYNILLVMQFLQEAHCKLDLDNAVVSFYDGLVVLPLYGKSRNQNVVRSLHSVEIPAATEAIINVSIPKKVSF